jgi:protein-disulfide isomerase
MLVVSVAAVLVGLVAVAALIVVSGGLGGNEVAAVSEPEVPAPVEELRNGRSLGDPDAPVTIEVFEDPQCAACAVFTDRIEPLIIAGPVTRGTASFTYNDFVFIGDESWDAAVAMRAAEALDGKFWDYHHILFHNQGSERSGAFSRARLADMAELIGLDREEFLAEMDDPEHRAAVEAANERARELEITSTPTLIVNGEYFQGVPPWEELDAAIEAAADAATS